MSPLDLGEDPISRLLALDTRRRDARRNGERIVQAALDVLAEKGFDAGIPEIAARAGVGRATVYRMFPTKAGLLGAVVVHELRPWIERLEAAGTAPDPEGILRRVMEDLFAHRATNRAVLDALRNPPSPAAEAALSQMVSLMERLLRAAQAEGTARADVTVADLRVLVGGSIQQLSQVGDTDPARWRHTAGLVMDALRP
jgi:AcrR family transcriptional regulator